MRILITLISILWFGLNVHSQTYYCNMGCDSIMICYEIVDTIERTVVVTTRNRNQPAYSGKVDIPSMIWIGDTEYSVIGIQALAFAACDSLIEVNIPPSVNEVGGGAFLGCRMLKSVILPDNLRTIRELTFSGCSELKSITFPDSLCYIGQSAFSECTAIDTLSLPSMLLSIDEYAFFGCSNLRVLNDNPRLSHIGDMAFSGTRWYEEHPEGLVTIGTNVYDYKVDGSCMKTIDFSHLPNPIRMIEESSPFSHKYYKFLPQETKITIPEGITNIGTHAFYGCRNLSVIHFPISVIHIEGYSFGRCNELSEIHVKWTLPLDINNSVFKGCQLSGCTLVVPRGTRQLYEQAEGWKDFGRIIEE
ncbi:MAG: leucine-rich repeat domain-containing protein [Bacteroidaceae bacterium]|nr:leucine-rich repeat domain-containing protein [Bacteroidaceae bacterium]